MVECFVHSDANTPNARLQALLRMTPPSSNNCHPGYMLPPSFRYRSPSQLRVEVEYQPLVYHSIALYCNGFVAV